MLVVDFVEIDIKNKGKMITVPIRHIISFSIETGRVNRTSRATVSLVRKKLLLHKDLLEKEGEIVIRASYKDRYEPVELFCGVIEEKPVIKDKIDIKCVDFSYFFKEIVNVSFENMSDKDIIAKIVGSKVDSGAVVKMKDYKRIRFAYKSVKWIIDWLAKKNAADYFFVGDKLCYGKKYELIEQKKVNTIDLRKDYIVENNLKYSSGEEDIKVVVRGTKEDGGAVFVGTYGSGSIEKEFFEASASSQSVKKRAEELYKELSFVGFTGDVKLFLEPVYRHSEKVNIIDKEENSKTSYIDKVNYTFSQSDGLKQTLYIGEEEK